MVTKKANQDSQDVILSRLAALEKAVFGDRTPRKSVVTGKLKNRGLPGHIITLRDSGFFKEPKTAQETHAKLQPTYACEVNRVAMALLRLHEKKKLRVSSKKVDGKAQKAYVW